VTFSDTVYLQNSLSKTKKQINSHHSLHSWSL